MTDPYLETVRAMGPDLYERMVQALATGLWPDGSSVTAAQREHTMKAVIAWGTLNLPPDERSGYIDKGSKARTHHEGFNCLRCAEPHSSLAHILYRQGEHLG